MLLVLASLVFLGSKSLGTRDRILLSQIWDLPCRRLLRLAGLRWRYSTPSPHGCNSVTAFTSLTSTLQRPHGKHYVYCCWRTAYTELCLLSHCSETGCIVPLRRGRHRKHNLIYCCVLDRVYRAVAWQHVDQICYNIITCHMPDVIKAFVLLCFHVSLHFGTRFNVKINYLSKYNEIQHRNYFIDNEFGSSYNVDWKAERNA
jgi:hypothetical protein